MHNSMSSISEYLPTLSHALKEECKPHGCTCEADVMTATENVIASEIFGKLKVEYGTSHYICCGKSLGSVSELKPKIYEHNYGFGQ